jgi:hypothetical protein
MPAAFLFPRLDIFETGVKVGREFLFQEALLCH